MGYIGDYIHFRHTNYRKFGIGRSSNRGLNFNNAYQMAKQELLSTVAGASDFSADQELEKYLSINKTNSVFKEEDFSNEFRNLIENHFNHKKINFETKSFQDLASEFELVKQSYSKKNTRRYNIQTINRFKQAITNLYAKVIKSGEITEKQRDNILGELKKLGQQMKELGKKESSTETLKGYQNIFNQFNEISNLIAKPTTKEKGDLAEIISYYMLAKASGMAEEKALEVIQKDLINPLTATGIVGGQGSTPKISFSRDLVDSDALRSAFGKSAWTLKDGENGKYKILLSTAPKQNTVDIILNWDSGEDIRASVKNYQSKSVSLHGVGIVKDTPLTLLFNLINTDFVNHYLNILSFRGAGLEIGNLKKSTEIIKKALALRGLSGYRTKGQPKGSQANIFIFNNSTTGDVRVLNIGKLLKQLMSLSENGLNHYVSYTNIPNSIQNEWVGGVANDKASAKIRITNIIAEVHKIKLSMSLKSSVLNNF